MVLVKTATTRPDEKVTGVLQLPGTLGGPGWRGEGDESISSSPRVATPCPDFLSLSPIYTRPTFVTIPRFYINRSKIERYKSAGGNKEARTRGTRRRDGRESARRRAQRRKEIWLIRYIYLGNDQSGSADAESGQDTVSRYARGDPDVTLINEYPRRQRHRSRLSHRMNDDKSRVAINNGQRVWACEGETTEPSHRRTEKSANAG